jgi:hypothetical protein
MSFQKAYYQSSKIFWSLVPTISWLRFNLILISILLSPKILANKDNPQFALGDKLSIFSDKAFRKDGGDIFEAIGNVIIISAKDTLYGESATFNVLFLRG